MSQEIHNNIDSHYSKSLTISSPKKIIANAPTILPKHALFSEKEANKKIDLINSDIYEGARKEKKKKEFDPIRFFKILGIVSITTWILSRFRK